MNDITRETKGKPREKTVTEKKRQLAQPQTQTQGGHEIVCLLNQNEQTFFIATNDGNKEV